MAHSGTDLSNISFDSAGKGEMLITVYHQHATDNLYDHATHRLCPGEVQDLRDECNRAMTGADSAPPSAAIPASEGGQ